MKKKKLQEDNNEFEAGGTKKRCRSTENRKQTNDLIDWKSYTVEDNNNNNHNLLSLLFARAHYGYCLR